MTVNLARSKFTISACDYTLEVAIEKHGLRSLSPSVGLVQPGDRVIVLGSAFLKTFLSVYHLDDETVSCRSAP